MPRPDPLPPPAPDPGEPGSSGLAVVIPTLNEEGALRRNLPALLSLRGVDVVVSDGGSSDDTVAVANGLGVRTVKGPPGRGPQLNLGARESSGEVLLFLHADTRLPVSTPAMVAKAIAGGAGGGGFLLTFEPAPARLRLAAALINLRTRVTHLPLGDQAQFVRRDLFEELGGFADWPILEDLDLARRLRRRAAVAVLEARVSTSARRYLAGGLLRTAARNWLLFALYFAGVDPRRLAHLYPRTPPARVRRAHREG